VLLNFPGRDELSATLVGICAVRGTTVREALHFFLSRFVSPGPRSIYVLLISACYEISGDSAHWHGIRIATRESLDTITASVGRGKQIAETG